MNTKKQNEVLELVKRRNVLDSKIKEMSAELDGIKSELISVIEQESENDGTSHKKILVGKYLLTKEVRRRVVWSEDKAKDYFIKKKLWKDVMSEVLDTSKVEKLVDLGKIPQKDLLSMTEIKESFTLKVKEEK